MEKIKVGVIVGEAKMNTPRIKKIIDETKEILQKNKDTSIAEEEFERVLTREVPAFRTLLLSEDALVELPLLSLFDVDAEGNIYMDEDKVFNVDTFSLLPEIVGLFNANVQTSFLILNKLGISLEEILDENSFCFCRKEKGIVKNKITLEEIFEDFFSD